MLGISLEDFLVDIDTRTVVREFPGHSAALTDIAFSADSRWLVSSQILFAVQSNPICAPNKL